MYLFNTALHIVLKNEGGYVNDPSDPGGETYCGISRRAHPEAWVNGRPTDDQISDIYKTDYWDAMRCDELPSGLAICVFDFGVNAGNRRAIKALQRVTGATIDGVIGPNTIAAANANPNETTAYTVERILYYGSLTLFNIYGRGWTKRAIETMKEAEKYGA